MQQMTSSRPRKDLKTLPLMTDFLSANQEKTTPFTEKVEVCHFHSTHLNSQSTLNILNYSFQDTELFLRALSHSSFVNEFSSLGLESYERLEFLGDSVVGLYFTKLLFNQFENLNEGELSRFRSSLVNEQSLAELANFLCLADCVLVGKGVFETGGIYGTSILSDTFEAIIGAISIDGGIESAFKSLDELLAKYENSLEKPFVDIQKLYEFDSKSKLQEITMKELKIIPEYKSTEKDNGEYEVELVLDGVSLASMTLNSKKKAEKILAAKVLQERTYKKINK